MQTQSISGNSPLAEQLHHNSTGWVGHYPKPENNIVRGQTFIPEREGNITSVELFSEIVTDPGKLTLSIHHVDPTRGNWGPALDTSSVELDYDDTATWVSFPMHGAHLNRGECYGLRIEAKDALVGIGETIGSAERPPLKNGQEWQFTNGFDADTFNYFSLAFRVEGRA